MSYSLSTDAFINTLRRFVSRRGKLHAFWSDNGIQDQVAKAATELQNRRPCSSL